MANVCFGIKVDVVKYVTVRLLGVNSSRYVIVIDDLKRDSEPTIPSKKEGWLSYPAALVSRSSPIVSY